CRAAPRLPSRRSSDLVLDEAHEVRELERYGAARLQGSFEPQREIVDVRHVSVDVVADDEVGAPILRRKSRADILAEKLAQNRNRSEEHTSELQSRENL